MNEIDVGKAAYGWWAEVLGNTGKGRAARARLRKAATPVEALEIEATHELNARLGGTLIARADTLALIAVALANLSESMAEPAAARMAGRVSALRFQRLVRIEAPGDLIVPLRRALVQVEGKANVSTLARDLFYWSDAVRTRWCFSYYGAGFAAPEPAASEPSEEAKA